MSRLKPVTPKGWIMLWAPPESMTSASPRRMISVASPIGLAAGGAGGEAVEVRALGVEVRGEVGGRHVRLLLELELRIEPLEAFVDERGRGRDSPFLRAATIMWLKLWKSCWPSPRRGRRRSARGRCRVEDARVVRSPGWAAPMANFVWRPRFSQAASSTPTLATDQSRTSAEICVGKLLASKSVVWPTPDLPSFRLAQSCGHAWCRGASRSPCRLLQRVVSCH